MNLPFSDASPLLVLAVVLVVGVAAGSAARSIRLPSITGQIVAGVGLGSIGLNVFEHEAVAGLAPLTQFALGLIAVTVGAHLDFRRLRNAAPRLLWLLACEAVVVPLAVIAGLSTFEEVDASLLLLFGAVAVATAPATIVAIVRESQARGVFVKTLVAAVALNNLACIFLFELARLSSHELLGAGSLTALDLVTSALYQLLNAALVGSLAALGMAAVTRFVPIVEQVATAGFITLLFTAGLANYLGYSSLMACMFLGLTQTNVLRRRDMVVDTVFAHFEPAILAVFFTLAGMDLTLDHAGIAGALAVVFFAARALGKIAAGSLAMRLAGATNALRRNIGMALVPQAGVAVGLVVMLDEDPVFHAQAPVALELFGGVVVTAVVFNELVGPILTRWAVARSGEAHKDRERLLDCIHEENIFLDVRAETLAEAVAQLVDRTIVSHRLDEACRKPLLESVLAEETEASSCLGGGLSVPHGVLETEEGGADTVGVMAVNAKGFPFSGPDGEPVRCIVLLASRAHHEERRLQILAMLTRTVGADPKIQMQLYRANTPAHVYDLLHQHDDAEAFNYFLQDID